MRLRNIPGAQAVVAASPLVLREPDALPFRGRWQEAFPVARPLHLEIGMGRGLFITTLAAQTPDVNYLGLEQQDEMIFKTLGRLAADAPPDNLRFLWLNAVSLRELFAPAEVDRIYLNFPDPWPKRRHAGRRLTAPPMLRAYREILSPRGELRFKTDNEALFDWSLENFQMDGWQLSTVSRDLSVEQSGVLTEYENRFRGHGQPIFGLTARCPAAEEE